jgi:hypothetical protein
MLSLLVEIVEDGKVPADGDSVIILLDGVTYGVARILSSQEV